MTKTDFRKIYLAEQKSLSDVERNGKSRQIARQFFENFNLQNIQFLHLFLPIEKHREIETAFIYKRVWQEFPHITTIVSRIDFSTLTLENLKFNADTKLIENKWQILEPLASEAIEIEKIDAVLVPLLCFDKKGFRIGYGKGFYDKFLKDCRTSCLKIGLSYFSPIEEITDVQKFDIKLDFCLTPETIVNFR